MRPDDRGLGVLERNIGRVLQVGVATSSMLLGAGLLLMLAHGPDDVVRIVLTAALFILFTTPAARVVISVVEYVRERDWLFVALTLVVLATLAGSVLVAFWSTGG